MLWELYYWWVCAFTHTHCVRLRVCLFPTACSWRAAEWGRVWLCGGLQTIWGHWLDASCSAFSRGIKICLQKREHPALLPLPGEGWSLQQRRGRPIWTRHNYLFRRGGWVKRCHVSHIVALSCQSPALHTVEYYWRVVSPEWLSQKLSSLCSPICICRWLFLWSCHERDGLTLRVIKAVFYF